MRKTLSRWQTDGKATIKRNICITNTDLEFLTFLTELTPLKNYGVIIRFILKQIREDPKAFIILFDEETYRTYEEMEGRNG